MAQELVAFEHQLTAMAPEFSRALTGTGLAWERVQQTVLWSIGASKMKDKIANCSLDSLVRYAMTVGSLRFDPNPNIGQIFPVPFSQGTQGGKGRGAPECQTLIGYKGFNTLGWRDGLTINGDVVREGEAFEYQKGTAGFVHHKPVLAHRLSLPIIGAWATATATGHAPIVEVMGIDEILEIKSRSPAEKGGGFSPWQDKAIGFPAMAAKTVKRRLARSTPFGAMVMAAAMEEAYEERGLHSWIEPDRGVIVEGQVVAPMQARQPAPTPEEIETVAKAATFPVDHGNGRTYACASIEEWRARMISTADQIAKHFALERFRELNELIMEDLRHEWPDAVKAVADHIARRLGEMA